MKRTKIQFLACLLLALPIVIASKAQAQWNAQFDAGASGYSYSGSGGYASGAMTGQTQASMIDPVAIATAQYFNWNGGTVGAGIDGRINTPPIGLAAMQNYREWSKAYDSVREQNRELREIQARPAY